MSETAIQQVFETVKSEEDARELLDAVEEDETMLEVKVDKNPEGFHDPVDTVRRFSGHDELQVRPWIGGEPLWLRSDQLAEEMVGLPARLVEYEGIA